MESVAKKAEVQDEAKKNKRRPPYIKKKREDGEGNRGKKQQVNNSNKNVMAGKRPMTARGRKVGSANDSSNGKSQREDEREVASKTFSLKGSRLYLDLKENSKSRFIKVVQANRFTERKTRITLSIPCAIQFLDKLKLIEKKLKSLEDFDPSKHEKNDKTKTKVDPVRLHSESITLENRRYNLDLKENARGRVLTFSLVSMYVRSFITFSVDILGELMTTLQEFFEKHCSDKDDVSKHEKMLENLKEMKTHVVRVYNKTFYFDVGAGQNGLFLRVSEVQPRFRTSITIPESRWKAFRDILNSSLETCDKFKNVKSESGSGDTPKNGLKEGSH